MRYKNRCLSVIIYVTLTLSLSHVCLAESYGDISVVFDHQLHERKVFSVNKIDCSHCHNFYLDPATQKVMPNAALKFSTFNKPLKQICHSCHTGGQKEYISAPHACYTCHRRFENILAIKPKDHENLSWKQAHSTAARVNGQYCMNCHMISQCVKCHLRRQDVEPMNHSRNFRFFHSIQVRAEPHRCDACHTRSFCENCHLGN